jgi:hypothetical protein
MKIQLTCNGCGLEMESNIYGKHALEVIKRYDTFIHGRKHCFRCTCGHDFHINGHERTYYNSDKVAGI